ncbi:MAG TPA: tail fiber protein [Symbiobacteriaceae bacterium]|nr:tail fiber protein [Symbiobacteriaceae bacterium]
MSECFIGEIRMFGGNFAPVGWAFCDGQTLNIAQNDVLFALIGTTYGGDGQTTFKLPDLRGRIPIHRGQNPATGTTYNMGAPGGVESVVLGTNNLPAHTHQALGNSANGTADTPAQNVWAGSALNQFVASAPNATMNVALLSPVGNNQPHDNMMPFLTVNFIIATEGLWPQQQ